MSTAKKKKNDRIDFRVSSDEKSKIQRAVAYLGVSTAEFVMNRIMPDVERALAEEDRIRLNAESWASFVSLLENPKRAPASLKKAMQEYRENQGV